MAKTTGTQLIEEVLAATKTVLEWYDGDRAIITEKGYTCPTPPGARGLTQLRSVAYKAQRHGFGPADIEYVQPCLIEESSK